MIPIFYQAASGKKRLCKWKEKVKGRFKLSFWFQGKKHRKAFSDMKKITDGDP